MSNDDPVRWKVGGETSPEFLRALSELGKPGPDVARAARVAEKLGAKLADAPPPGASKAWSKWLATKGWITGILLGIATLSWVGFQLVGPNEEPLNAQRQAVVESLPLPPAAMQPAEESRFADVALQNAPPAAAAPSRARSSRRSYRSAAAPAPALAVAQTPSASLPPGAAVAETGSVSAARDTTTDTTTETESQRTEPIPPLPPKLTPAREASSAQSDGRRSEVELLLDARKAMRSEPAAALRVLDEHAARFPGGHLGPEREVLRIEVLQKLGRSEEATQRVRRFESLYPGSFHLRLLQKELSRAQ